MGRKRQGWSDFSFSQKFYITAPLLSALSMVVFGGREMDREAILIIVGGCVALSLLLGFIMVYGDEL